jgi:hypothetical protein
LLLASSQKVVGVAEPERAGVTGLAVIPEITRIHNLGVGLAPEPPAVSAAGTTTEGRTKIYHEMHFGQL